MSLKPHLWAIRGQASADHSARSHPADESADHASVTLADEAAEDRCFDKRRLAYFLGLSVRSLDRANAVGLLPCPDLVVGRSPRWSPETVHKWLRTHPRLPGRKGGDA